VPHQINSCCRFLVLRSLRSASSEKTIIFTIVFEDLPYEPNFVMDKIENFWALIEQFFEKNDRTFKIFGRVILAVLYNVYFFGAVAYYIQYKVKS